MPESTDPKPSGLSRTRELRESGGSTVLTVPPEIIELAGLEAGDELELELDLDDRDIVVREATGEN